ncbi:HEAT repeat domain-containing protein [Patescibacteria group bacterium]|nr:HEAT repeat domain-containing protein [Patescibacteria group bacterium]
MKRNFDPVKLKAWLVCPDPYQKGTAVNIVWHDKIADPGVVVLVEHLVLTDDTDYIRCDAIRCLGDLGLVRSKECLIKALSDNHYLARGHAVLSLEKIDPNFLQIPEIRHLIEEETHPFVRWALSIN